MQETRSMVGLRVTAPARLHLGFLDLNGGLGRRYGSLGLAIDEPSTVVRVTPAKKLHAGGDQSQRVQTILEQTAAALSVTRAYRVEVESAIPAHSGLGSGTQLALAIATGIARLEGRALTVEELAALGGRGARSSIGTAAFRSGGFIVDGGRGTADQAPPVLVRTDFPSAWRILLVMEPAAEGASGDREAKAFANLPDFPEADAGRLCRLVLMRLLPGLKEADIAAFGSAITEIQEIVGRHFAPAQGGNPFTSPAVGEVTRALAAGGAHGIGQTSWGPTGFAFVPTDAAAHALYDSLVEDVTARGLEIRIVRGRNSGAVLDPI